MRLERSGRKQSQELRKITSTTDCSAWRSIQFICVAVVKRYTV
ncbi:hypothetical protein [Okeania sp. KiyG1]|nr:hypothetical protein [Okeania sp. KiyG1]